MRTVQLSPFPHLAFARTRADHLVITPNARAAQALGVSPVSLNDLAVRLLSAQSRVISTDVTARKLLRDALSEVVSSSDASSMTYQVEVLVRELLRVGVPIEGLRASGSRQGSFLADVVVKYLQRLSRYGFIDEAEKLWVAAELVQEPQKLLVVGYPRVGRAELHFLDAIAADGSVFILPADEETELFKENVDDAALMESWGWTVREMNDSSQTLGDMVSQCYYANTTPIPNVTAIAYPDLESEVRGVLGQVKALLAEGHAPEDIVLVSRREESYGPALERIAREYGLPLKLSYKVPLTETRIGAWLQLLCQVIEAGFPFELTAQLLNHSLTRGLSSDVWTSARVQHPQNAAAWSDVGEQLTEFQWPAQASREDYVDQLNSLLEISGVAASIDNNLRDQHALRALERNLLAAPVDEQVSLGSFLSEVRESLAQLTAPYQPDGDGVSLHSPLAVFGARFRYVFVLGLAEGEFPEALTDPPLLDFYERKLLVSRGLPLETAAARARRERLSVWATLQLPTKRLVLSYPKLYSGQVQTQSSIFSDLGVAPLPPTDHIVASVEEARQRRLLDDQSYDDPVLEAARHAHAVEQRRESHDAHDEYDGKLGIPLDTEDYVFSATQLNRLGQCPFRWFVGEVFGVGELEEAEDDLGPTLRGKLYHTALELAVKAAQGSEDLRAATLDVLERAFEEAERKELPNIPNWDKRRAEHLRYLERAVRDEEFIAEGHSVAVVEERFKTRWNGLNVSGVVDRIDSGPGGNFVKDYKTSSSQPSGAKNEYGQAKVDVQLPLYIHATREEISPDQPVTGGHYYSLTKRERRVLATAEINDEALSTLAAQVTSYVQEGFFPVDPDVDGKACTYCEFSSICRKGPRIERKRRNHADT